VHGALAHFLAGLTLIPDGTPSSHSPGSDDREAHHHFTMAALSAPDARKLYHLALAQAARRLRDPEAAELACASMWILWPDSSIVAFRAADGLLEIGPGTGIAAARAAHALGTAPAGSTAPNDEWLASQEERALISMRKLVERGVKEKEADPWYRVQRALDRLGRGWQDDLSRGRREAVIRKWLAALDAPPFTGIRAPADCPGLPDQDHDNWRRAWAAIDALARSASAAESR
jgi:hypothetical protein